MTFNLKSLVYIFISLFLFSIFFYSNSTLLSSPSTFWDKINHRDRLVSYVDKSGYLNMDAIVLDYEVNSNETSLYNEIYLENIYVESVEYPERKSIATFVFHASKDINETILGVGMYVNASPFEDINPGLNQSVSFSGIIYSTDRKGSDIFVLRFPLRRCVHFSQTDSTLVEYNVNIKQLAYFVDIQRPDKSVTRLWINNNGRDFNHNEIFSEMIPLDRSLVNTETQVEKVTYKIKTDKPIFDAARHYYCSSFFER